VLVEVFGDTLERAMESPTYRFMKEQGYDLFAKTFNTLIFGDRKVIEALARTAPVADQAA
jgi:predicted oxidoreductase (fatty acid repression mutant protein)